MSREEMKFKGVAIGRRLGKCQREQIETSTECIQVTIRETCTFERECKLTLTKEWRRSGFWRVCLVGQL